MDREWMDIRIAGAVMAGGRSSRMGGRHKGSLLTADGKTFTERLVEEMRLLSDCIYISYGDTVQMEVEGCRIVQDIYSGCGPIGGLHAVLRAAAEDGAQGVMVGACDMPFAGADLYRYMYEQVGEDRQRIFEKYDGVVAVARDGTHPLAAIYSVKAADILEDQLKRHKCRVMDALRRLRILFVDFSGSELEEMLGNINTEEEYIKLVKNGDIRTAPVSD